MSVDETNNKTAEASPVPASSNKEEGKLCAILAYLVLGIIWYFADEGIKKNSFAKFHVKQAIILIIISILGTFVLSVIPILGWIILPFFGLVTLVLTIIGIVNALNGEEKQLPLVGPYADKYLKF